MDEPIEIATSHRCHLGTLTDDLARIASAGVRGDALACHALDAVRDISAALEGCCLLEYLALAPKVFEQEIQLPVASADVAELDTRVLLWPIGSADRQHPHTDGWAIVMAARGTLFVSERRNGDPMPERRLDVWKAELIRPEEGVHHHMHNRGEQVGLSVHVFGT